MKTTEYILQEEYNQHDCTLSPEDSCSTCDRWFDQVAFLKEIPCEFCLDEGVIAETKTYFDEDSHTYKTEPTGAYEKCFNCSV